MVSIVFRCIDLIDRVAKTRFPGISEQCLKRPIFYSRYLTKEYTSVEPEALKEYIEARLEVFYEEVVDIPLVVFESVMDHILRIDRVLRQPLGHCLLVGKQLYYLNYG